MIKRLVPVVALAWCISASAFAQVEANRADLSALDGVKWIGPTFSRAIVDERKRRGPFKDWRDFERRIKGVDERRALAFSEAGLTVNGKGRPDTMRGARR